MSNQKKYRSIKNYLILPSYQLRLVSFICVIIFIGSIMHGGLLYYLSSKKVHDAFLNGQDKMRAVWEMLQPAVIVSNGLSFIIMSILVFLVAVLISHKVLGPMLKISGHVKKLSEGDLTVAELRLREGDEGKDLCSSVNELKLAYNNKFIKLRELEKSLKDDNPAKKELENILKDIKL